MFAPVLVEVLYFASLKEQLGLERETLELPSDEATLHALTRMLLARHPSLMATLSSIRFAVNEEFQTGPRPLSPGDVIALIPPVSGG